ncbi:AhpC/TSA family protein [Robertkochia marina]|uniref:AhpC/TSA family protein n=1 Tax=Robertkochia marina TaxID=1227945 RepID=A0A4S3M118_9FLAO|nr:TlpA disulfide reductase family protein [Robertkochia marina]THD67878.1 AhpC/TSA family protein [Robertkochia marina]TRZ42083.1 AhpC/TSA family protein [Robertkochia marina]
MKKLFFICSFAMLLASCSETPKNSYTLNIQAEGIADSTKVFIQKINPETQGEFVDTLQIMNGKAEGTGIAEQPMLHVLYVENIRGGFPFVLEEGNIEVIAYKDSLGQSVVEGTPTNEEIKTFKKSSMVLSKKYMDIRDQLQEASKTGDTVTMNVMRETYAELQEDAMNLEYEFVKDHPASYFSPILMNNMLRSKSQPADSLSSLYNSLDEDVKASEYGKFIGKSLEALNKVKVGATAPSFSAATPEGAEMSLKEALGKVTIIDFWAAWCKPCRIENPNMVKLYEQYHDKGLNVIGVSLDQKKEAWVKAIEEDQLPWYQVSTLQGGNDPIAREYQVNSIPATFVLDENGVIIAKGLRGEALYEKIAELLP